MSAYHTHWRTVLCCLSLLGMVPLTASGATPDERWREKFPRLDFPQQEEEKSREQRGDDRQPQRREQPERRQAPRHERDRSQYPPRKPVQAPPERRDRSDRRQEPRQERDRQQPPPRKPLHTPPERRDRTDRQKPREDWDRIKRFKGEPKYTYPERRIWKPVKRKKPLNKHDRHHKKHPRKERHPPYYPHRHENHHYHTYFLAPIHRHYIPRGYRLRHLPRGFIRIVIGGFPYFYYSGVFYRHYHDGYIVVGAPIGALVYELPIGFITFSIGNFIYYFVNDTYYIWDDDREAYVVVEKPDGADEAIAAATEERLYVYPNLGQSQEQQSRDRYECHRWAVHETGVDPSLWDEYEITYQDRSNYKRAISACLEGRGYTVK